VTKLQAQELELANAIATLSRVTANLANRQQRFENFMFSFNRQLLEEQIITTRRSTENRKLIMSQNARETQRSIEENNSRKLILQALKTLKNIPSLRNGTTYRNQIAERIIHNTEIYRLIQGRENFTKWVDSHPLILRNQSYRLKEVERMQKAHKKPYEQSQDLNILEEYSSNNAKTHKNNRIHQQIRSHTFPWHRRGPGGIGGLIRDVSQVGLKVLGRGTQLVENVVDKGLNVLSEPIKIVIITASIICGIFILLIACKYFKPNHVDEVTVYALTDLQMHPHIWKYYNKYH